MRDKVVFLRLGALGDLLVSLAALEKVVRAHPQQEVIVCGSALWLDILTAYPQWNIRSVFVMKTKYRLQQYEWQNGWRSNGKESGFSELCRATQVFYNLRFESLRYSWLGFLTRIPVRYGSSPRFFRFLFTHWYGWLGMEPPIHERDWLYDIVSAPPRKECKFGNWRYNRAMIEKHYASRDHETRNRIALPVMQLQASADVLRRYGLEPKRYILINPTASRRDKAWPAENFRRLSGFLRGHFPDREIRVVGSPAESAWLAEAAGSNTVLQPQSLNDLFAILESAAALVTNTSSMQFIASANGVPTLTLMGWAHPLRWGPLGPENLVIRGETSQARNIFERDGESYRSIRPENVEALVLPWLKSRLPR